MSISIKKIAEPLKNKKVQKVYNIELMHELPDMGKCIDPCDASL
jgi:hypothetical protein